MQQLAHAVARLGQLFKEVHELPDIPGNIAVSVHEVERILATQPVTKAHIAGALPKIEEVTDQTLKALAAAVQNRRAQEAAGTPSVAKALQLPIPDPSSEQLLEFQRRLQRALAALVSMLGPG
jgi:hypothetical protein